MKKFLLSIFAVMLAVFSVQAEEVTFNFKDLYGSGTLSSIGSKTVDGITISYDKNSAQNAPAYNKDGTMRLYYGSNNGNSATFTAENGKKITSIVVTASSNSYAPNVKYSVDGGAAINGAWSSTTLTITGIEATTVSIQNVGTAQLRTKVISVTYETSGGNEGGEGGGETPEQPEEPVVPEEPETPEDGIVWNLVEDVNDIKTGDEVIIVADGYDVALGALSSSYHTSTPVTVSDNTLTYIGNAVVLTVGKNGDYYTFSYDNKYLNWTSGNAMNTATTVSNNTSFTIEITEGVTTISNVAGVSEGRELQYNASSPRFACYKGTQQSVCIYKKTELLYHSLTVTDAGWATLYLPTTARIPSNVEAYTVTTVNDGWVSLTQVTGVIPSQTGIIVKAAAGDYKFFMGETATADVTGNLLEGTLYNREFDEEAYVLGQIDGVVGLYLAEMTDGTWLNNANKAYLPVSAVPNASATFYGFDWEGTTGIENVTTENVNVTVIYDLTGRRVEAITAPGIYVVNGKKVLVK